MRNYREPLTPAALGGYDDDVARLKLEAYRKGQPRSRRGNAPKFNKAKARARVKAARKARRAGR